MKRFRFRSTFLPVVLLLVLFGIGPATNAQVDIDEVLQELEDEQNEDDLARIENSALGVLRFWDGVDSDDATHRAKAVTAEESKSWGWRYDVRAEKLEKLPGKNIPISNTLAVPKDGNYRIWLRHAADLNQTYPVKLRISGANQLEHVFGRITLTSERSRAQEEAQPIRFEATFVRLTMPAAECQVWEYLDADLVRGDSLFELSAERQEAKFSHIFISASKSFTPRLPMRQTKTMLRQVEYEDSTLLRVYYRFRVTESDAARYSFKSTELKYHWFFDPKKETYDGIWGVGMGQTALHKYERLLPVSTSGQRQIAVGEWTDWLDATWASQGSGPWSTGVLQFEGLKKGKCEIEIAWYPHPSAVVKQGSADIDGGFAKFIAPLSRHGRARVVHPDRENGTGVWGVVGDDFLDWFKSLDFFHKRYAAWAQEARDALGIPAAPHIPPGVKFIVNIKGNRAEKRVLAKILVSMGFNTLADVPPDICREVGAEPWLKSSARAKTCDPADPARPALIRRSLEDLAKKEQAESPGSTDLLHVFCVGDEIGCCAGIGKINQTVDSLARFHRYLNTVLEETGETPAFFGVESVDELKGLPVLPRNPGLFERRLFSHSIKFKQLLTADFYRPITEISRELFPNSLTYANYSPAPMRQGEQVHSLTWFTLPRQGAVSMAWGEDWVYPVGTFTGYEIVSYYAAFTECAARKLDCAAGFYNVVGGSVIPSDSSIVSSLSRNLKNIYLYTFGPSYNATAAGTWEGCWSDIRKVYPDVVKALHVAGFVGRHLAAGAIEKRRVAVLVNRDHEIMHGGHMGEQSDRALIFAALGNCNRNADLVLNEDLAPEVLQQYAALFINGFCLPREAVPVLTQWVEKGGLLIASANSAVSDAYDSPLSEMEEVFGARQFNRSISDGYFVPIKLYGHEPIGKITVRETKLTPPFTADVIGMRTTIVPTTAEPVATFEDGTCAATWRPLGKGHVLLWGVQPGILYKGHRPDSKSYRDEIGRYDDARLAVFEKPLAMVLGVSPLSTDAPQVELTRFDLGDETAILVNNFKKYAWTPDLPPMEVKIKLTGSRRVTSVSSAMHGELKWARTDDGLRISSPVPSSVDSLLVQ